MTKFTAESVMFSCKKGKLSAKIANFAAPQRGGTKCDTPMLQTFKH